MGGEGASQRWGAVCPDHRRRSNSDLAPAEPTATAESEAPMAGRTRFLVPTGSNRPAVLPPQLIASAEKMKAGQDVEEQRNEEILVAVRYRSGEFDTDQRQEERETAQEQPTTSPRKANKPRMSTTPAANG